MGRLFQWTNRGCNPNRPPPDRVNRATAWLAWERTKRENGLSPLWRRAEGELPVRSVQLASWEYRGQRSKPRYEGWESRSIGFILRESCYPTSRRPYTLSLITRLYPPTIRNAEHLSMCASPPESWVLADV